MIKTKVLLPRSPEPMLAIPLMSFSCLAPKDI